MITTYLPIFKDKLAKLESRGLGDTEEAQRLRATLNLVKLDLAPSKTEEDDHLSPEADE